MKYYLKSLFLAIVFLFFGCTERERSSTTYRALEPELKSKIFIEAESVGHWHYKDREIYFEDFQVKLTNLTNESIWVSSVNSEYLSEYILQRNPPGYSYQTWVESGNSHLSMVGLGGPGPRREILKGESISFIAPIPLNHSSDTEGLFRIEMRVYLDPSQIRPIRSDILVQSPVANQSG